MRIKIPEIYIEPGEGFLNNDIFKRREFGQQLCNLFKDSEDNLVVALDSEWGEGKSTFIKMWEGEFGVLDQGVISGHKEGHKRPLKIINYDAFANDFQKDPFIALMGEIYALFKTNGDVVVEQAKKVLGILGKTAIKMGVRAASAGLVDLADIEGLGSAASDTVNRNTDSIVENAFKSSKNDRDTINKFKVFLEEKIEEEFTEQTVVFVIDELDRCRPDYALELLECIKHLFDISNIHFLLVTKRNQLEASIEKRYGLGRDSATYLHKFIDIWLHLPIGSEDFDKKSYVNHLIENELKETVTNANNYVFELFKEIVQLQSMSLRNINRMISYYLMMSKMAMSQKKAQKKPYQCFLGLGSYLFVEKPELFIAMKTVQFDWQELQVELDFLLKYKDGDAWGHVEYLYQCLHIDYAGTEDGASKKTLIQKYEIENEDRSAFKMHESSLAQVCKWLSSIEKN